MAQALALLFGLLIGSFLNVIIWRMPRGESIAWPASHCPSCKTPIRWHDNIPVLAYLILKGKCRFCPSRIPFRYPVVELLGGIAGWAAFTVWGGAYAAAAAVIFWALIAVIWIDWEHQIIPDEISLGGIAAGLLFSFFFPVWVAGNAAEPGWRALLMSGAGVLVGGGILYLMALIGEWVFKKEAMGGGDVKLLAAVGAFFGWQGALFALFAGSVAGSFVGLAAKYIWKKDVIPFGPYLALGTFLYMLWGQTILSWYVSRVLQY
ncbi:MAG: prepilin peptidase [Candidatus Omnitrophica bacterium]|jgi:leader peptidase (prepilin peptidase)/N-methyltransferase|nr:prepilin peptidase [Candidatus Omnitrophota bacterium]